MNIVVEGIDGSGKSVLIKQLTKDLKMKIFWPGGPPASNLDVLMRCDEQAEMDNVIFDRVTCISDQCYHIPMSISRSVILKSAFSKLILSNPIIIYTIGIGEISNDGYNDEKHDLFVKRNYDIIYDNYKQIMSTIPHIKYDFKVDSYADLLLKINFKKERNDEISKNKL